LPLESISEVALGVQHGQRQSRKASASADIGDTRAEQVCIDTQGIEQVMREHRAALADRGEVVGLVPGGELIEQLQEQQRLRLA